MLTQIFATAIYRGALGVYGQERDMLRDRAVAAYEKYNINGKPWSRSTRQSLEECDPAFVSLFAAVKQRTELEYGVRVKAITGRELIQNTLDFVPPHVESSHLSAIYWIDCDANPNGAKDEHDGCLVLNHPAGSFGSKCLPDERRNYVVEPRPDSLLIFPSHILHFGHVYLGKRPSVEVHFEMEIE
jgi:hypothetical protein